MGALTPTSSLHELLEEYPFLVGFLADFNPRYAMLEDRGMRATAARFATLGMVAGMGGVEVGDLIRAIEAEVHRQTGNGADGSGTAGPSGRLEKAAALKSIIEDLHGGLPADVAKARFDEVVRDVSPREIGAMEEQLIREGTPVEEIQRLCDLHVAIVRSGLEKGEPSVAPPGHPAHTYMRANEIITRHANRLGELCAALDAGAPAADDWQEGFRAVLEEMGGIHNHYLRKENELFPVLERHGITGPSKVMWGVHDEIRAQLKAVRADAGISGPQAAEGAAKLARAVIEMVYKENKILLPLALETLTPKEWAEIRRGEDELGYAFVEPAGPFPGDSPRGEASPIPGKAPAPLAESDPHRPVSAAGAPGTPIRAGSGAGISLPVVSAAPPAPLPIIEEGYLDLGTGRLSLEQVDMILRHLPVDLSFVDVDGYVRYYSETAERLFPRTPGAIGRHVTNCHPPKSVHMVEEILRAFAAGERDVAEFWIEMQGKFIHIRYFAVRNPAKAYLGCLEVTQDVTGIRALEGQRRLLEWN
jgi:DUF438 domain-containing protein